MGGLLRSTHLPGRAAGCVTLGTAAAVSAVTIPLPQLWENIDFFFFVYYNVQLWKLFSPVR